MIRRFNAAFRRIEYGQWYTGRFGRRLWRHVEWASATEEWWCNETGG
jgi:hypothetical protein